MSFVGTLNLSMLKRIKFEIEKVYFQLTATVGLASKSSFNKIVFYETTNK